MFCVFKEPSVHFSFAISIVRSFFAFIVGQFKFGLYLLIIQSTIYTSINASILCSKTAVQPRYTVPSRYAKAPTYELETMVEIVDILAFAQKVVEDRNLSLLLRAFYLWVAGTLCMN